MNKSILISLIIIITISCNNHEKKEQPANNQTSTPEVLDDKKNDLNLSSVTKRYDSDIIQTLFEEAVEKDEQLKSLTQRMEDIDELKADSLNAYRQYIRNNTKYWSSVNDYINQISDSTTRKELEVLFGNLEDKYKNRIDQHETSTDKLKNQTEELKDQEILMKLIVTQPMMNNYQRNELPDINSINAVIAEYDTLIEDIKPYTEIEK